jgi:hypothetical protein
MKYKITKFDYFISLIAILLLFYAMYQLTVN